MFVQAAYGQPFFVMSQIIRLKNVSATAALAQRLVEHFHPGMVICLDGDLGAGKTTLVRSLVEALGGDSALVSSPTFALLHEYRAQLPVYHFDVYRLADSFEFIDSGFEEYLYADGVCILEWGNLIADILPENTLYLKISIPCGYDSDERELFCSADWDLNYS